MSTRSTDHGGKKTAGAFDIRSIIGALLGIYGVVLIIVFAVGGDSARGNNDDNLWTGIVLLAVGLVFLGWARLRPIVVRETPEGETPEGEPPAPTERPGLPPEA